MEPQFIALTLATFFLAAFLKGITGLGFATVCLGLLTSFLDIRLAIPLVFLPSLTSNLLVMKEAGRFGESLQRFWPLYLSSVPGLLLGMWLLGWGSLSLVKAILGLVLICYGIWGLCLGITTLSARWGKHLLLPVGVTSGFINGATGSQIMPILPYLMSLGLDKNLFVQTLNTSFTFSTMIMMVGLGKIGILTLPVTLLSATGIIPVAVGIRLGSRVREKVSETLYRRMVLMLLILLGCNLALRSLIY